MAERMNVSKAFCQTRGEKGKDTPPIMITDYMDYTDFAEKNRLAGCQKSFKHLLLVCSFLHAGQCSFGPFDYFIGRWPKKNKASCDAKIGGMATR
jgi:hypothetical protein